MKKLPLLTLTALSAIGILWACGGGSNDGDDSIVPYEAGADVQIKYDTGADGPDPAAGQGTAFCDGTLGLIRTAITSCCAPAEATALQLDLYKNISSYVTKCENTMERSIGLHRTSPKPQDFEACENAFQATFGATDGGNCRGIDAYRLIDVLSPACATAFTGKGQVNDSCAGDFDCASGACIGYTDTADGKCQDFAPQNGTCGTGSGGGSPAVDFVINPINSCSSGLYCSGGNCQPLISLPDAGCSTDESCEQGACIDQHCNQVQPPGPRLGPGGYCHTSEDCNTGLFCDQEATLPNDGGATPGSTGVCTPSRANGQDCAQGGNGAIDHECIGKCSTTCVPQCNFP